MLVVIVQDKITETIVKGISFEIDLLRALSKDMVYVVLFHRL